MTLYVLDTDHLSLFDRNHPFVVANVLAAEERSSDKLSTTVISFEEQLRGRLAQVRRSATNAQLLVSAYRRLVRTFDLFDGLELLEYSADADTYFRSLRRSGVRVGTQDLRIASIVVTYGGVLLTRNRQDFERVPELEFQDWSIELS